MCVWRCYSYLSTGKPQVLRTPGTCCPLQKMLHGLVGSIQTTGGHCDVCPGAQSHKPPFSTTVAPPRLSSHLLGGSIDPSAPGEGRYCLDVGSTAGIDEHKPSGDKICRSYYSNPSLSVHYGVNHLPLHFDQGLGLSLWFPSTGRLHLYYRGTLVK